MNEAKEHERWDKARLIAVNQVGERETSLAMKSIGVMIMCVRELAETTGVSKEDIMEAVAIIMESYRPK